MNFSRSEEIPTREEYIVRYFSVIDLVSTSSSSMSPFRDKVQYRWLKSVDRDESAMKVNGAGVGLIGLGEPQQRKTWIKISNEGHSTDPEFAELLYPAYSRLVVPSVSQYAEYQCVIEDSSGTITAVYAHVFPYDSEYIYPVLCIVHGIQFNKVETWIRKIFLKINF